MRRLRAALGPLPFARQFPQHPDSVDPCRGDGDRDDLRALGARRRPFGRLGHVSRGGDDGPLPVGVPLFLSIPAVVLIGAAFGAINACFITGLRMPLIVTLATLFVGRGFALYLSETKMVFQSDTVQTLGRSSFLGLPWAIWIAAAVACAAWITLTQTPYGRQIYAVGADPRPRRKPD